MFTVDKQVEFAVSQEVGTYMGLPRVRAHGTCNCGAYAGQFHNIGCKHEICPVCEETKQTCGCDHD